MLERKAFSTSSQIFIFSARSLERRTLPFGVLEVLDEHFDDVAGGHAHAAVRVVELVDVDGARALVADVDDDILAADLHDDAADDLLLAERLGLALERRQELVPGLAFVSEHALVEHGDAAHLLGAVAFDLI